MGASPSNEVTQERNEKETKWGVQVDYIYNSHKMHTSLTGLDAPTESEATKALYKKHGANAEISNVSIFNKWKSQG